MKITKEKNNVKQGTNSYGRGIISINTGLSTKEKKKKKIKNPGEESHSLCKTLQVPSFVLVCPSSKVVFFFVGVIVQESCSLVWDSQVEHPRTKGGMGQPGWRLKVC